MKVQLKTLLPLELVPPRSSVAVVLWWFAILNSVLAPAAAAQTGPTAQEMNNSNNPLTPALGLNLQDQYVASYYGLNDSGSNGVLLRGVVPPQAVRMAADPAGYRADCDLRRSAFGFADGPGRHQRL